ncbi:MAG: energy-coupling factor transporter transmembrane component T family protein [Culicoidibacterales bacterium]
MKAVTEQLWDKFSLEFLRNQVLKNAYGNNDTIIAKIDPRTLLVWYVFFGVLPWFMHNPTVLLGLFIFVAVTTRLARVAPLVLVLFCFGVLTQSGYLLIVSLFFGGNLETLVPILIMTLKVSITSLASITVFSGLNPDRLASGLLWFGCPDQFAFSIGFAYRILPILIEEFQNILLSHRLRGKAPEQDGFFGKSQYVIYQVKIIMVSFLPLMLNIAKRSRTTVEALELRGYRYANQNKVIKKMKIKMLQLGQVDFYFAIISIIWLWACFIFALS